MHGEELASSLIESAGNEILPKYFANIFAGVLEAIQRVPRTLLEGIQRESFSWDSSVRVLLLQPFIQCLHFASPDPLA